MPSHTSKNMKDTSQETPKSQMSKFHSLPAVGRIPEVREPELPSTPYRYSLSSWMKTGRYKTESQPLSPVENKQWHSSKFISHIQPSVIRRIPPAMIFPPQPRKVKILLWSDLTLSDIERLNDIQDYDQIRCVLADIFRLGNYKQNLKASIVLDLYYYTLQFARQHHFSPEQTSVFFSIIKKVFEVCQETPYGNLDYTYKFFKELLFCHCVNRPPVSIELFTKDEAVNICTYTLNTFFRHFKLYKYVFTPTVCLDLTLKYVGTSPMSPMEADVKEAVGDDEEEDNTAGEETDVEEIDFEKIQAQEELKRIVAEFLIKEARKIEGNVDNHLRAAVDTLNAKLDPLLEIPHAKNVVKGKRR